MEYIVSARKYRPATFDSVVGQSALTTTLKNAVRNGKLAHAYLFCGPRGVGKTTCARIFAKTINCQNPTADGEACNECESCQSFNDGRSLNIFELDAASNNSVEHIKTLMEQTRIPPQLGKYKVFIIDEVHMLSTQAFNAFLKTLEEPPAHVIFILATTEKHKILPTILSRCQTYDFERMTVAGIVNHLKNVAEKEGISYEEPALAVIAEKADGGMRDALSIFDQAASFCQGNITYEQVTQNLNVLDAEYYFRMTDMAVDNKVSDIMLLLNTLINKGFDGALIVQGLAKHVRNLMMARDPQTLPLLEVSEGQRQKYEEQAKRCTDKFLYKALRIMNRCDVDYRQSGNKRLLVELTLIEVAQITQPDDEESAGRGPRRLKSLFKNIMRQKMQEKAALQVAAASAARTKTDGSDTDEQASQQPTDGNSPTTNQEKLGLKASNIGFSWSNIRKMTKPGKVNIIAGSIDGYPATHEHSFFTQQDLELQWLSMCNRMPQQLSGIASRMKNMNPVLTEIPHVEVTVDNNLVCQELEKIKGSIQKTLRLYLHNEDITLDIRVNENPIQEKLLTRSEQLEVMTQQNPALKDLQQAFDLVLA